MTFRTHEVSGLAVVVVLYNSADVIEACIRSLLAQRPTIGRIILVDNDCPEGSAEKVRKIAAQIDIAIGETSGNDTSLPAENCLELIRSTSNLGFAGGVNLGLRVLHADSRVGNFWILNPDCELTDECAERVFRCAADAEAEGGFSLLGTRILYNGRDEVIQSDGGVCCHWTGRCRNLNQGAQPHVAGIPEPLDLPPSPGASMVASRKFLDRAGFMPDEYFLYYEEVAWARARQELPLIMCHSAIVRHHGGTAIGSGAPGKAPSPLANYFNFRNRMRFIAQFHPLSLPICYLFSLLKTLQTLLKGHWHSAVAAFRGMHGLAPPDRVRGIFSVDAQLRAFSSTRHPHLPNGSKSSQMRVRSVR